MSVFYLRFGRWLGSSEVGSFEYGPRFTRWLPNGEENALTLLADNTAELTIWFKRHGKVVRGFIKFEHDSHDVPPDLMSRQGILDAGPLYGMLKLQNVSAEEIEAVVTGNQSNGRYKKLGKRIGEILTRTVGRFITILRTNYGQYWLEEIEAWDSRRVSMGQYFSIWNARWSLDNVNWTDFQPDLCVVTVAATMPYGERLNEYIAESDWKIIQRLCTEQYEPPLAANLLVRCHRLLDQGQTKYALVEGISALELAIEAFVDRKLRSLRNLVQGDNKFQDLRLVVKMALVANLVPVISAADIEATAKAIETRNEVVHEGKEPRLDTPDHLRAAIRVAIGLLDLPAIKLPRFNAGNRIFSAEEVEGE